MDDKSVFENSMRRNNFDHMIKKFQMLPSTYMYMVTSEEMFFYNHYTFGVVVREKVLIQLYFYTHMTSQKTHIDPSMNPH